MEKAVYRLASQRGDREGGERKMNQAVWRCGGVAVPALICGLCMGYTHTHCSMVVNACGRALPSRSPPAIIHQGGLHALMVGIHSLSLYAASSIDPAFFHGYMIMKSSCIVDVIHPTDLTIL